MRRVVYLFIAASMAACANNQDPGTATQDPGTADAPLTAGDPGTSCDDVNGSKVACYTGPAGTMGVGLCKGGTQFCQGGLRTDCLGEVTPTAEVCDGKDNDCDGMTDENGAGNPLSVACYDGPPDTIGVGPCHGGVATCQDGVTGACTGEVVPDVEVCNGADDDCNGKTDDNADGSPLTVPGCYTGPEGTNGVGECKAGSQNCQDGELSAECSGEVTPTTDVCDGLDNDCNGSTDLDPSGNELTQACYTGPEGTRGIGECKDGSQTCIEGGWGACLGEVDPTDEVCDGKDNDCDAMTDEDSDGNPLAKSCYTGPDGTSGVGICTAGTQECCNGDWDPCTGEVTPAAEACGNGLDDDCNGVVDTDCLITCLDVDGDGYGKGCDKGVDCNDDDATVNPGMPEWCGNEKDDNCNGLTDEVQCFNTSAGNVLVVFNNKGDCPFDNLYLTEDVAGPNMASQLFREFQYFTPGKVYIPLTGGIDGLHRLNLEFDTNGMPGDEMLYVNWEDGMASVADQCGTLEVYYNGMKVPYSAMKDPRNVTYPFGAANAFLCFGDTNQCYLCGGDWDDDGTPDCSDDGGAAYCAASNDDKDLCTP